MPTLDDLLQSRSDQVRELFMQTRELVRSVMPDATEQVMPTQNNAMYGSGQGMRRVGGGEGDMIGQVCYIAPFKSHVNLGFFRGMDLPDPDSLLEGTGKMLRHVKIRSQADLERPSVRALLEAAVKRQSVVGSQ
jgi:hypothetical protein